VYADASALLQHPASVIFAERQITTPYNESAVVDNRLQSGTSILTPCAALFYVLNAQSLHLGDGGSVNSVQSGITAQSNIS
jgi:hypothetical protein